MKFGIFYEHQLPRPWDEGDELQPVPGGARPGRARRPARASTTPGRSSTTSSRSTRTRRRPRCSSPRARSARKRIRLGHGIVLTPPPYNHPAKVAARIATLDLVSNGRVDFGTGESASRMRARGLRHRPGREARDVARGDRADRQHARDGSVPGLPGRVLLDAVPQPRAEAGAEAASADVAGVLEPRDDPHRRASSASAR